MSTRLAYRPRYHNPRPHPRFLAHTQKGYLRQGWSYRQQNMRLVKRAPGYSLSFVPFGWRLTLPQLPRRA